METTRTRSSSSANGTAPTKTPRSTGEARFGSITTRWELITPEVAAQYLALSGRNRTLMPSLAARYAADQKAGDWLTTHQGLAFNEAGELVDGRHRCQGIIDSGVTVPMLVTRGLSPAAMEVIDRGRIRTMVHVLQILGLDVATPRLVAVARQMMAGPVRAKWIARGTDIVLRKFVDTHREPLLFVCELLPDRNVPAGTLAVLARAYYTHSPEEIRRFVAALLDEIPTTDTRPGDASARKLTATYRKPKKTRDGQGYGMGVYRLTQTALVAYFAGTDLIRLSETTEDLFPLPGLPAAPEEAKPA